MAALELPFGLKVLNPLPVDDKYLSGGTPYTSVGAVNGAIVEAIRHQGLTVNINGIEYWYKDIIQAVRGNIPIVIVGNKSDLEDKIVISEKEIKDLADKFGFHYILTSAKTGDNVNDAFLYIAYRFLEMA